MAQNQQQMALLKNRLEMPLIIRDYLVTNQNPSSDANYALHEMISDLQPDEALLSSALVMKEIASYESIISTDLVFLNMECERLIERYSARDDLAQDNPLLWEESQGEMMRIIAEDTEGFLELISLCQMSFEITNPKITSLLEIITIQLQSHLIIVDEIINMLETQETKTILTPPSVTGYKADNIIMFPA